MIELLRFLYYHGALLEGLAGSTLSGPTTSSRRTTRKAPTSRIKNLLPIFSLLICLNPIFSQPYSFINYSLAEGLPQSQVFALCQDHRGYLWLGTQGGGLSRFDGKTFTNYSTANGLPANYISALAEDGQQQLWVGTNRGLCRFDGRNFETIQFDSSAAVPEVYALARIQDNLIWIGTDRGLFSCASGERKARPVSLPGLSKPTAVTSIFPTKNGVWVGTEQGAWLIGARSIRLSEREGLAGNTVRAFARDQQQQIWIASVGGLAVFDEKTGRIKKSYRDDKLIWPMCLQADTEGQIWVGTQNRGLHYFNPADSSWTQLLEKDGLPHQHIRCLLLDDAGRLWLGSSGGGLARLSRQPFRHFDQARGLAGNRVYALHEDRQGRIWLGVSAAGLQLLDSTGMHTFERDSGFLRVKCKTIAEDAAGNLWVGTEGKGLVVFDSAGMHVLNRQNGLPSELVQKIIAGPDSSMWIATSNGGIVQARLGPEGVFILKKIGLREGLPNHQIQTLLTDPSGIIWFSTLEGQIGYLKNGAVAAVFNQQNGLPGLPVRSLALDAQGRIWAGTKGGGIFWADPQAAKPHFQALQAKPPAAIPPNIYLLKFDSRGQLWAGSETGVDQISFDPSGKNAAAVQHFGRAEGFLGIETCHDAVLEDHNGQLWFGTMNGLVQHLPGEVKKVAVPPQLHFEDISLFYKPLSETAYAAFVAPDGGLLEGLEFPHHQNHLSFAFQGVDISNPGGLRYRWKLEGAETDWSPMSTQTQVNYAKLPPGAYTFLVQASTDGALYSEPKSLSFVILEPLWQMWWFQLSAALFVLALVLLIARARIRRIRNVEQARREQLELENRFLQLEQKALQLQMNPHFIFNALTSIQALLTKTDFPKARQEINRFASLMRGILANSRRQTINLQEEVNTLEQYLQMEQFCQRQKFEFEISLPENVDPEEIELPPMLLQPFVENAVLHGVSHLSYPGKIEIQFRLQEEMLLVEIRDNGIGRERAARLREEKKPGHQSAALQVTQERLAALGGALEIEDILNENAEIAGTKVLLRLPVHLNF